MGDYQKKRNIFDIILIRIQQRWVYFVRYFTHSYTSICNHLL